MHTYRRDIDTLRAIGVLGVIAFHLGLPGVTGGFAGVDIFFVISGYLITGVIVQEVDSTGSFHYQRFYVRRIRRLFPALLFVITATLLTGAFLLPPDYMQSLGGSAVTSLMSISNIYFWLQSGYFDSSSQTKPLLHTWSLSIEEQFYLLWPLIIALSSKLATRRFWPISVGIVVALSFLANLLFKDHRSEIFFLLPFRAFELGIGGLLVWLEHTKKPNGPLADGLYVTGLGLAAIALHYFTEGIEFPSYNALLPCVGTALAIYSGNNSRFAALLDNRITSFIGRSSYSLYLVHWPIIVLYQYQALGPLTYFDKELILVATFSFGALSYNFIENPFRIASIANTRLSNKRFFALAIPSALLCVALGWSSWHAGWRWRYPADVVAMMDETTAKLGLEDRLGGCFMYEQRTRKDIREGCYKPDTTSRNPTIILVGDSTANHLTLGLHSALGDRYQVLVWSTASCAPLLETTLPPECMENNREFFERVVREFPYSLVIFSSHNASQIMTKNFKKGASILDSLGIDYVLLGQLITYRDRPPNLVARYAGRDLREAMKASLAFRCDDGEYGLDSIVPSDRFFSMKKALCDGDYPIFELHGKLVQVDSLHFTDVGSNFAGEKLAAWLQKNGHLK